jgi:hypothetical protein
MVIVPSNLPFIGRFPSPLRLFLYALALHPGTIGVYCAGPYMV